MADLQTKFNEAAENVKKLSKEPSNDEKLAVYALFKQATVGDCNIGKPGMFDMTAKAKWEAWNGKKGKSKEDAQQEYITLVEELQGKYN